MSGPDPVIVVGGDDLAFQTILTLTDDYRVPVSAIVTSGRRTDQIMALTGIRNFATQRVDEQALRQAGIAEAGAIALLEFDDAANLQAALVAQEIHPDVRTVIRSFNVGLASRVRLLLNDAVVLSDSDIAATAWIEAGLDEPGLESIRLGGERLRVCRREDVAEADVVAGLAGPGVLPGDDGGATVVLAFTGDQPDRRSALRRRPGPWSRLRRALGSVRRSYYYLLAALAGVLAATSIALASFDGRSVSEAFLGALLILVGQSFIDTRASSATVAIEVLLAVVSVAFVPTIAAAVVDALVSARLAGARGRDLSAADHVVLIGLGNLGTQVLRRLGDLGFAVTAVERNGQARGVDVAGEQNAAVVVGDATQAGVLTAARVWSARAVLLTIPDDFTNLEVALTTREINPGTPIVLRLRDDDFATRLGTAFGMNVSRDPAAIAAPAFAHAMVCHEPVVRVLTLHRQILVIAEVTVEADSALSGALLSSVNADGLVRVFGIVPPGQPAVFLPPDGRIEPDTRLFVVCTQVGLAGLLARARSPYH